jgi:tetratricopeptide (TPR) repeat protein
MPTAKKIDDILKNIEDLILCEEFLTAKKYLLKFIQKYPEHPVAYYYLGEVYCKLGYFKKSIKELEYSNKLLPNTTQIVQLLGWAYFMSGNLVKGRYWMQKSLSLYPNDARNLCELALLEIRALNKIALKYVQKAIDINPNDQMVQEIYFIAHRVFNYKKLN